MVESDLSKGRGAYDSSFPVAVTDLYLEYVEGIYGSKSEILYSS